jgi:hypothetical protein
MMLSRNWIEWMVNLLCFQVSIMGLLGRIIYTKPMMLPVYIYSCQPFISFLGNSSVTRRIVFVYLSVLLVLRKSTLTKIFNKIIRVITINVIQVFGWIKTFVVQPNKTIRVISSSLKSNNSSIIGYFFAGFVANISAFASSFPIKSTVMIIKILNKLFVCNHKQYLSSKAYIMKNLSPEVTK